MEKYPGNKPGAETSKRQEFEALMRAEGAKIYTLAVRLSGNIADGQDLAQETFLQAFRHWDKFRGESQFGTWVYRICVNLWKNRVRYEKRRFFWKHFSLNGSRDDDQAPLDPPAPDAPLDRPLETDEKRRAVLEALDRLAPEEKALLVMRDMEDKSYEDIADLLGVPLGTVKSRLARGREKLKNLLKGRVAE